MDSRSEVREFLMSRRARVTPDRAGIETFGDRRRVPGLRREEVARLAGLSVDYYTRLERGNLRGVSDAVLEAIARAMMFDAAEREHLFDLARNANPAGVRATLAPADTTVRPELQYLLGAIQSAPAFLQNNRMDLVAGNALALAMYSPLYAGTTLRPVNFSRHIFLDPSARDFYPDWDRAAWTNVTILRREAGRNPRDKRLHALVGELSTQSVEFREYWAAHDVRRHYAGQKTFRHPVVGGLELHYQTLELDQDPGLSMTVFVATPGSPTEESLRLLASWAMTEDAPRTAHRVASTEV
ncbi:helix-turn-helix transcriptional regulator [Microbacterium sp. ZXX196]|uniref:helix-turn-helix transcriptional regulator n=1 Tax=Microbacterium sp. ZXX196 TaxID=2609291 RepID=UPI0012B7D8AA|nr:helix-turn-helix transcriptional regulator [Microbacterium sp. ZXX196]MTE22683.1 helix-turn-helix domain-containing protein [Microbacterium sp. ZXX196]